MTEAEMTPRVMALHTCRRGMFSWKGCKDDIEICEEGSCRVIRLEKSRRR
jgi:hypothetical protein